jgi:hypothetical protein
LKNAVTQCEMGYLPLAHEQLRGMISK